MHEHTHCCITCLIPSEIRDINICGQAPTSGTLRLVTINLPIKPAKHEMSATHDRAIQNCKSSIERFAEGLETAQQLTEETLSDVSQDEQLQRQTDELKEILASYDKLQRDMQHTSRALAEITLPSRDVGDRIDVEKIFVEKLALLQAEEADKEEEEDVVMSQVQETYRCPITQRIMENPVRNTACNHSYSKDAILELLQQRKGRLRCPVCGDPVHQNKLVPNKDLERKIRRYKRQMGE